MVSDRVCRALIEAMAAIELDIGQDELDLSPGAERSDRERFWAAFLSCVHKLAYVPVNADDDPVLQDVAPIDMHLEAIAQELRAAANHASAWALRLSEDF